MSDISRPVLGHSAPGGVNLGNALTHSANKGEPLATTARFQWNLVGGEIGGNSGSNLQLQAIADDGKTVIATPISIDRATGNATIQGADGGVAGGGVVSISGDVTITSGNAATYNGMTLVFAAAHTVTLDVGLPSNFGFAAQPPASGNASIASDGTVLLNGATTTITRALSGNMLFGIAAVGTDSYAVTGS